ncbi:MAG: hypothetical protein ACYCPR_04830 [Thermoplasmataceae archaeon]
MVFAIAGLILIHIVTGKRGLIVRDGEAANDQEPGGCWNEQQGYLPTGGDQEINSPWDPQIGVRKAYPLKSVDLFIYHLSMFLLRNKELFVGQLTVKTEKRM